MEGADGGVALGVVNKTGPYLAQAGHRPAGVASLS